MPPFGRGTRQVIGVPKVARALPTVKNFNSGPNAYYEPVYQLAGVSRTAAGAVLGGCTCTLFRVIGNDFIQEQRVISDVTTGAYFFNVSPTHTYRVMFDLDGAPVRAGLTLKTLTGV